MRTPRPALLALLAILGACDDAPPSSRGGGGGGGSDPGALVDVTFDSKVGVLLDEVPEPARTRLADALLAEPAAFWRARAARQVEATLYRLVYRNFYYDDRGQLPLPPQELWSIETGAAARETIDGHDLVTVPYTYASTLLASATQPAAADPALGEVGGVVEEAFTLPVDPELLLERTGYACMNESDFPPNSVDTENARLFFDDTCDETEESGCHLTEPLPTTACVDALRAAVGAVDVTVTFTRAPWDGARADAVRTGERREGGPELEADAAGLEDRRVVYRYFPAGSCAIAEGCVGGAGFRRLLQFTATVKNLGDEDSALGDVGPESAAVANRLVSFSPCHGHMHFNHYGRFTYGEGAAALGSKRAFCLESTSRISNDERTPLVHPYSCAFQGTAAGWADDYIAGLDCQWIDVTDAAPGTAPLRFDVNPDGFLCEGAPIRDERGALTFEETELLNEDGERESKLACEPFADAAANNVAEAQVDLPATGGMVTAPCARPVHGPRRNCGFAAGDLLSCGAGEAVRVACTGGSADAPLAVRLCEASAVLGAIPCTDREALGAAVLGGDEVVVDLTCPAARDAAEPGGAVGVFAAPVVPGDAAPSPSCRLVP